MHKLRYCKAGLQLVLFNAGQSCSVSLPYPYFYQVLFYLFSKIFVYLPNFCQTVAMLMSISTFFE